MRAARVDNLWRECICVLDPIMIEVGTAKACLDGVAFEKDDAFHNLPAGYYTEQAKSTEFTRLTGQTWKNCRLSIL